MYLSLVDASSAFKYYKFFENLISVRKGRIAVDPRHPPGLACGYKIFNL
jgi:hypothetical protein